MELELLGLTGLAAFLVGGGVIMLISAFRRTIELRAALIHAMRRIDRLEAAIASGQIQVEPVATDSRAGAQAPSATSLPSLAASPAPRQENARPNEQEQQPPQNLADVVPPHPLVSIAVIVLAAIAALAAASTGAVLAPLGVGVAILAGACGLGAAEWSRNAHPERPAPYLLWRPDGAAANALCGLLVIVAAIFVGRWALHAFAPEIGFYLAACATFAALVLAPRFGQLMFGFGALLALVTPALAAIADIGPLAHFAFLLASAAILIVQSRRIQRSRWAWIGAAIATAWIILDIAAAPRGEVSAVAPILFALTGFLVLGGAYAWNETEHDIRFPAFWRAETFWRETTMLGALIATASVIMFFLALSMLRPTPATAGPALTVFVAAALGLGVLRQGQWLAAWFAAALALACVALWPQTVAAPLDAPSLVTYAATLAFVFAIGGGLMMARASDPTAGVSLAALAPIAMFAVAYERIPDFGAAPIWALAALAIMALNGVAYFQFTKPWPHVGEAFASGALLSAIAFLYVLTPTGAQPFLLALVLPALALAARFQPAPSFRLAAQLLCAVTFVRLIAPEMSVEHASSAPGIVLNFLPAIIAALAAGLIFHTDKSAPPPPASEAAYVLCAALAASLITLSARNVATAGAIAAPYANLMEMGANTLAWLGAATFFAWRFGATLRDLPRAFEFIAFAGALTHALVAGGLLINPWWGFAPAEPQAWNGLSAVLFAYLAPGLLFIVYAFIVANANALTRARIAMSAGLLLCFLALNLEIRSLFHGGAMATAPVSFPEAWSYTIAWLGFAAALLALSSIQQLHTLRFAAFALAFAALLKAAVFDAAMFGPLVHAIVTAALLVIGLGGGWFYRRTILPWAFSGLQVGAERSNSIREANLAQRGQT